VGTTPSVQDYLKTIYALRTQGEAGVNARLAERLGVSAPSVSAMMKRLESGGLVEHLASGEFALTESGEAEALRIVRRHRLIETFLHRWLDMPWDEVHDEAEVLEHAVSARLEDRIAEVLGHPTHDPHGDPIPPKDGPHQERWPAPLKSMPEGAVVVVERVSDRDPEVLRYLAQLGIRPGSILVVERHSPFGGPLWVRVGKAHHALGDVLVASIFGSIREDGATGQPIEDGVSDVEDRHAVAASGATTRPLPIERVVGSQAVARPRRRGKPRSASTSRAAAPAAEARP
jgi:DtxR family Mn-dependent transcriptional regulator